MTNNEQAPASDQSRGCSPEQGGRAAVEHGPGPFAQRARFWAYTNKGLVRITVRRGQSLTHVEGGPDAEGYSYTCTTWSFDGTEVTLQWATRARDCDGMIERGGALYAMYDELAVIADEDCKHAFPHWKDKPGYGYQRDHSAEAAGY